MENPDKKIVEAKSFEQLRLSLKKAGEPAVLSGSCFNSIAHRTVEVIKNKQEQEMRNDLGITSDEVRAFQNLWDSLKEPVQKLAELCEQLKEISELGPTPTEIKRHLKYAKNPMEIRQLNQQLAVAYKKCKGKNAGGKEHGRKRE